MKKLLLLLVSMFDFFESRASDFAFVELRPDGSAAAFGALLLPAEKSRFARAEAQKFDGSAGLFWASIEADLRAKPASKSDLLIYVHGYNGSREPYFSNVLGQMERDFMQNEACSIAKILAIKWETGRLGYQKAADSGIDALADEAAETFKNLIELRKKLPAETRLHFLGNSMAARLFERAFSKMEAENGPPLFDQAVFAAADLEVDLFEKSPVFQQKLPVLARRSTFLFNEKDRTLAVASLVRGQKMLGRSGPRSPESAPPNIFFEAVTGVRSETFAGAVSQHLYFSQSRTVVARLLKIWGREGR